MSFKFAQQGGALLQAVAPSSRKLCFIINKLQYGINIKTELYKKKRVQLVHAFNKNTTANKLIIQKLGDAFFLSQDFLSIIPKTRFTATKAQ